MAEFIDEIAGLRSYKERVAATYYCDGKRGSSLFSEGYFS